MEDNKKSQNKKEYFNKRANYWYQEFDKARSKNNLFSENFIKLEIEIASIVLAFTSISVFDLDKSKINWLIIMGWFLLFLSLIFGLVNTHIKQKFWHGLSDKLQVVNQLWMRVAKGSLDGDSAEEATNTIMVSKISSPSWSWIFQTIFLFLGLLLILVFILFKNGLVSCC